MLIEFKAKNFKSFKDEFIFSLKPVKKLSELKYSIIDETINKKTTSALCSSVIYGPNAAGKTSIINAMSCLRQIIMRGNILDAEDDRFEDFVSTNMSLIPFIYETKTNPVCFDIIFTNNNKKFQYTLEFYVGHFDEKDYPRTIVKEDLIINDKIIFMRDEYKITVYDENIDKSDLLTGFNYDNVKDNINTISKNLLANTLFLTSDFDSYFSKKIVESIKNWFGLKFDVVNRANNKGLFPAATTKDNALIIESINDIAKEAGIIGSDFAYIREDDNRQRLLSVISKDENKALCLPAETIESVGTLRLISLMPIVLKALTNGGVLVMDEMDASLHPMIVMNIIKIFHNDDININHAQIVFNTHNPIYLDAKLFRRDEIKFVEKDHDTKESTLYALSDFRANGEINVRKTTDYLKNYFINRYGAIEDIDLSDIVKRVIVQKGTN